MSIYKRISDSKNDKSAFEAMIKYALEKPYTDFNTNVGSIGCRKENALHDMTAVKRAYHKDNGRMYEHSVLSITPDFPSNKDGIYMEIGRRIAAHIGGHQCVYALHKDSGYRHLHFIWNTVSYVDGKRFTQGPSDLNQEKIYINKLLEEYDFDPVRTSVMEITPDNRYHDIRYPAQFLEIYDDEPDNRDMFLAPTPEAEEDNEEEALDWAILKTKWFGNNGGNYMYKKSYSPARMPQFAPAVTQTASIKAGNAASGNGLNLVNVNNIKLASMNDLSQATSDFNNAFNNSASAGATALATMRRNGIDEGVTVTTVNNFIVNGNVAPNSSPLDFIEVPSKW